MGQKDLSEKLLADYNDVFADIINVLVLDGQHKINAEELVPDAVHSQYKADDRLLHDQERDISKYWKKQKIRLALFGIENQTTADRDMPFRVIGYDGAAYRQQLLSKKKKNKKKKSRRKKPRKVAPVITLVLYFGTEKRWNQPLSIKELLDVPDFLDPYVNDYRIHVFKGFHTGKRRIQIFTFQHPVGNSPDENTENISDSEMRPARCLFGLFGGRVHIVAGQRYACVIPFCFFSDSVS